MRKSSLRAVSVLFVPCVMVSSIHGSDFYVDVVRGNDTSSGLHPGAAWRTISHGLAAIPAPVPPDTHTIHVAEGTYDAPSGESFPLVVPDGVFLVGDRGADRTSLVGIASVEVVHMEGRRLPPPPAGSGLSGFTVCGGVIGVLARAGPSSQSYWGNVTLTDLNVTGNAESGIDLVAPFRTLLWAKVARCLVRQNGTGLRVKAFAFSGGTGGRANADVTDSSIVRNAAEGVLLFGDCSEASPAVALRRCRIGENGGWGVRTEGLDTCGSSPDPLHELTVGHSLVWGNALGGIQMSPLTTSSAVLGIGSSTVADNGGVGIEVNETDVVATIDNTILWGNVDDLRLLSGSTSVRYTDVGDGDFLGLNGNASEDPEFVDPSGNDYHLAATSPLIDQGNPGTPPGGTDADHDPALLDGDADGLARIDMGYDEFNHVQLTASGEAVPGSTLRLSLLAPPGWLYVTEASPGKADLPLGGLGSRLIDPVARVQVASGVAPGFDPVALARDPSLAGRELHFQAVALQPSGPLGSVSNRVSVEAFLPRGLALRVR